MSVNPTDDRELGAAFLPKFDAHGLLSAVAVDSVSGAVLMLAFMDAEALAKTRETGFAHFHSRSRGRLWMKGKVRPEGPACHTGATSCFFRRLDGDELVRIDN
jgi:phosphoribosyl-AMP cyclohydrolase